MKSQEKNKKVFVGLSGGVDSAVSATLLKKEGYKVTGVFIKAWNPEGFVCTWREDRRSAMRVCAILDIPFITLDLEKEYKKEVVDYMIREYKAGKTPNPDVMCNKEIKFGHFLKFALKNGADFVATGHYARSELRSMNYELWEGKDVNKDQSYFLWTLTQEQLKHILFPIGNLQKEEVRKLAKKFCLPQATRKDSQGLCFLGQINMKEFLKKYIKIKKGKVLDLEGKEIGEHNGAILYTIGERHGFTITKKTTTDEPLYVIAKDIKNNTITIHNKSTQTGRSSQMCIKEIIIKNINIIGEIPKDAKIECRFRYRQEKIKCKIDLSAYGEKNKIKVIFEEPQFGVSIGQSLVFYKDEICKGGGIIGKVV